VELLDDGFGLGGIGGWLAGGWWDAGGEWGIGAGNWRDGSGAGRLVSGLMVWWCEYRGFVCLWGCWIWWGGRGRLSERAGDFGGHGAVVWDGVL